MTDDRQPRRAWASLAPWLALAACTAPTSPAPVASASFDPTATAAQAILGGSPDTTHSAVVAVQGRDYLCSGTIIQVQGAIATVITAAHCCQATDPPLTILTGDDYAAGAAFDVVPGSVTIDPCYEACLGSPDDVCLLQFSGASSATPVIPLMAPETDNLTIGTQVTYVGYGLIGAPPNGANSQRRSVVKPIRALDAYTVRFDEGDATGPCLGDSGGPGLVVVDGVEQIAVVTSVGNPACDGIGSAARVSSAKRNLVTPYLLGATATPTCPKAVDCELCAQASETTSCGGGCGSATYACTADPSCASLTACYAACSDADCTARCTRQNLPGLQKYEAIASCVCAGSCSSVCVSDALCLAPKCGATPASAGASCATCLDDQCCAEAWTCSEDPTCAVCAFGGPAGPSCTASANAAAYRKCAAAKCGASGCTASSVPGNPATEVDAAETGAEAPDAAPRNGGRGPAAIAGLDAAGRCSSTTSPTSRHVPGWSLVALVCLGALGSARSKWRAFERWGASSAPGQKSGGMVDCRPDGRDA